MLSTNTISGIKATKFIVFSRRKQPPVTRNCLPLITTTGQFNKTQYHHRTEKHISPHHQASQKLLSLTSFLHLSAPAWSQSAPPLPFNWNIKKNEI
jgi:hypothetical protein